MRKIETFDWWPELVRVKDDYSLRELAERFKVTPGAITAAFKRTSTSRKAAPPGPRARRRPRSDDEALPPEPGELKGRPHSKDDRLLHHLDRLGQVPDGDIAELAGVSVRTVASFRARHEIPGYAGPRRRGPDRTPRRSRIDAFSDVVGTVPDHVVAKEAGVSVNAVRNWRAKRSGPAAPTNGEAEPVASGGVGAWRVVAEAGAERSVRVVVAASLGEAASRAEGAGLGQVLSLEWVGELLA